MNFKQYDKAVHKHIKLASFAEVDAHYKLGTDPQKAAKQIMQARRNKRIAKKPTEYDIDFDYSMNY